MFSQSGKCACSPRAISISACMSTGTGNLCKRSRHKEKGGERRRKGSNSEIIGEKGKKIEYESI